MVDFPDPLLPTMATVAPAGMEILNLSNIFIFGREG